MEVAIGSLAMALGLALFVGARALAATAHAERAAMAGTAPLDDATGLLSPDATLAYLQADSARAARFGTTVWATVMTFSDGTELERACRAEMEDGIRPVGRMDECVVVHTAHQERAATEASAAWQAMGAHTTTIAHAPNDPIALAAAVSEAASR